MEEIVLHIPALVVLMSHNRLHFWIETGCGRARATSLRRRDTSIAPLSALLPLPLARSSFVFRFFDCTVVV